MKSLVKLVGPRFCVALITLGPVLAGDPPTLKSSDTILAIDDSAFESVDGLSLSLYEARKHAQNPLVTTRPDGPDAWRAGFPWVLLDGGKFRMWYLARDAAGRYFTCYAESSDGITWQRPRLGLVEHNGSKSNNICYEGHTLFPMIYRDARATDPARRYIGTIYGQITKAHLSPEQHQRYGDVQPSIKCLAYSPDGLRWKEDHSRVFPIPAKVEGGTLFRMADTWFMVHQQNSAEYPQVNRWSRFLSVSSSKDLQQWQLGSEPAFHFDPRFAGNIQTHVTPGYLNYGNVIVAAQGLFYDNQELIDHETDITLILSNDGRHWRQPKPSQPLSYLLRRGGPEAWDRSFVVQGNFVNSGSKTLLYYNGSQWGNVDADGIQIGVAELRLDGFGSLAPKIGWQFGQPGPFIGTLISKAIRVTESGLRLFLNVRAGADSRDLVKAELTDAKGVALPGFSFADCENLNIDSIGLPVAWRGGADLSALAGHEVKVKLQITAHNPERSGKIRVWEPHFFAFYFDSPRLWLNREQRVFATGLERQHLSDAEFPALAGVELTSSAPATVRLTALDQESALLTFTGNATVTLRSSRIRSVEIDGRAASLQEGALRFHVDGVASIKAQLAPLPATAGR